jgi:hypothetical protein
VWPRARPSVYVNRKQGREYIRSGLDGTGEDRCRSMEKGQQQKVGIKEYRFPSFQRQQIYKSISYKSKGILNHGR